MSQPKFKAAATEAANPASQDNLISATVAASQHSALPTQPRTAESVFHTMKADAVATFDCKLMFVTKSKFDLKLVVKRAGNQNLDTVYCREEQYKWSGVKTGDEVSLLVERRIAEDTKQTYWNVTALGLR